MLIIDNEYKINYEKFDFIKKENIITIKYDNEYFILEPKIMFETYGLKINNNINNIGIIIDENKKEHKQFLSIINNIYNKFSEYIEKNEEINIFEIINPLNETKNGKKVLNIMIHENNIIWNFDNKSKINIKDLKNNRFHIYPTISSPRLKIYNEKAYISFGLTEGYIKFIEKNTYSIKYENVYEAINKM
jgi:hypothetical protein